VPPQSLGTRVTLASHLNLLAVTGAFQIVLGEVLGGPAETVYSVLNTMVYVHSYYVESLLLSYNFPLSETIEE
jgi:hypothetical protein